MRNPGRPTPPSRGYPGARGWLSRSLVATLSLLPAMGCGSTAGQAGPTPTPAVPVTQVEIDLEPGTRGLLKRRVSSGQPVRLSVSLPDGPSDHRLVLSGKPPLQDGMPDPLSVQTRDVVRPGELLAYRVAKKGAPSNAIVHIQLQAEPPPPGWRWEDEGTWLAGETAERLVRLLYAASRGRPAPDDLSVAARRRGERTRNGFEVTVDAGGERLQAAVAGDGVWRPDGYDALIEEALAAWGPFATKRARPIPDLPGLLARSPAAGLDRADRQVSARLDESPGSAAVHEDAALVLGCLGLREAAGSFTDTRRILSRMTAHLAAARAMRSAPAAPSATGVLAGLTLDALAGRQAALVERLDASKRALSGRGTGAWARALRIRATGDWRLLTAPARATALEQLEHFRAVVAGRGASYGLELLEQIAPADLPDWGRIVLTVHGTVEAGNLFANGLLETELGLARRRLLPEDGSATPEALVSALLAAHESGSTGAAAALDPAVIGRQLWAAHHERHVVAAVAGVLRHLNRLGMRLEAEEAYRTFSRELGSLPLFPLMGFQFRTAQGGHPWRTWNAAESCEAAAALSRERPERLMEAGWRWAAEACPELRDDGRLASLEGWFGEVYLQGAAYWPAGRLFLAPASQLSTEDVEALHRMAPWNYMLAYMHHGRIGGGRPETIEESYGPLLEINHTALRTAIKAYERDPEAYVERYGDLCEVDADECYQYAHMLKSRGRPADVVRAYERALRHGRDRLRMSNHIGWLVSYYAETGKASRAFELAREAAAVGSHEGLATLGGLLEQTGRIDDASLVFHRLAERYEAGGHDLDRFLAAYLERVGDDRFGPEAEASFSRVFPGGLERVDVDDFDGPPFSGVVFAEDSAYLREAGLGEGGVVVALDGYRVHNVHQYLCVRRFRFDREFEVIVYYQAEYRKVRASLPLRSFAAAFVNYPRS